jgi:hypothetical protein
MKTIQSGFESFRKVAIPAQASMVQQQEMQMAFYAGSTHIIKTMISLGEPNISEDAGVMILENLRLEAIAYAKSLKGEKQ